MKKLLVVFLILGIAAGQVFAEITFGGWGRANWAPLAFQGGLDKDGDETIYAGVASGPGWDADKPIAAVGFEVKGKNEAETIGFGLKLRIAQNGGTSYPFPNDNTANIWVKPFSSLTLRAGMYQVDDLRGKIGGLDDFMVIGGQTKSNDDIFQRFNVGTMGMHLKWVPIDALQIHASVGENGDFSSPNTTQSFADVFGAGQYGVGYTIDGIGFARLQFLGGTYDKPGVIFPASLKKYDALQLAFQLTAVEGLNLDVGAIIPFKLTIKEKDYNGQDYLMTFETPWDDPFIPGAKFELDTKDSTYQGPVIIALGADYTAGDLAVRVRLDTTLGEAALYKAGGFDVEIASGFGMGISVQPKYKIGTLGTLIGVVSFGTVGNSTVTMSGSDTDGKDGKSKLGLGVGFQKDIGGGGSFRIGLNAQFPAGGDGYDGDAHKADRAKDTKIAVPIVIIYDL